MNTFNLGLVFGEADAVVIIVCASEEPLERNKIAHVASVYFHQGMATLGNINELTDFIASGIEAECGCKSVTVTSDVARMIK